MLQNFLINMYLIYIYICLYACITYDIQFNNQLKDVSNKYIINLYNTTLNAHFLFTSCGTMPALGPACG